MNESGDKLPFDPFKNDHQSMQIGELIFENQTDKVIIYGDIDLTKSELGLQQALKLQNMINKIVEELQKTKYESNFTNPDSSEPSATNEGFVSQQTQTSKEIDNPFS